MLYTLGPAPETIAPRPLPDAAPVGPRWLGAPPPHRTRGDDVQLAPGVWIVRHRRWRSPGDLDTAAELSDPLDRDPAPPRTPRYQPPAWHRRALCAKLPLPLSDPLFFGAESLAAPEDLIVAVDAARRVCRQCPVARECLSSALAEGMNFGVWAGTSGKQRKKLQVRIAAGESVEKIVDECLPALA